MTMVFRCDGCGVEASDDDGRSDTWGYAQVKGSVQTSEGTLRFFTLHWCSSKCMSRPGLAEAFARGMTSGKVVCRP